MAEKTKDMISIKQNVFTNDIMRHLNCIRNIDRDERNSLGAYEVKTEQGSLQMEIEPEELDKIKNKLKYANIKKLFLYFLYRMNIDKKRTVTIDIKELLDFKGQKIRTENKERLLDDLKQLEKIKVSNYSASINNKMCELDESFLFICERWLEESCIIPSYISVTAGAWVEPLLENNHYAYIPPDIFTFNKLEFDIAYNVIFRLINERTRMINKDFKFSLSVNSLLKNIELNVDRDGPTKIIDKIEGVLNKLELLDWFSWSYRKNDRSKLPGRNKLPRYREFMIDFNCKDSSLLKK